MLKKNGNAASVAMFFWSKIEPYTSSACLLCLFLFEFESTFQLGFAENHFIHCCHLLVTCYIHRLTDSSLKPQIAANTVWISVVLICFLPACWGYCGEKLDVFQSKNASFLLWCSLIRGWAAEVKHFFFLFSTAEWDIDIINILFPVSSHCQLTGRTGLFEGFSAFSAFRGSVISVCLSVLPSEDPRELIIVFLTPAWINFLKSTNEAQLPRLIYI